MSGSGNFLLLQVLNYYRLDMLSLAQAARVEPEDGYRMLKGESVKKEAADKIMRQINKSSGMRYTLEDIGIKIEQEGH